MYKMIILATAKNLQQGYVAPEDVNTALQQAQLSFTDYLLGEFQTYASGRPVPRVQFGMNESVRQRVTPLIGLPITLTIDGTGFAPYPDNYQQMDAMMTTSQNRIRFVPQHKQYSYIKSQIDEVATNPVYLIVDKGFQFYPITLGNALLSYVKTPPAIVWGYIPDENGLPGYNPGTSTDPVWYDVDCYEIISRALKIFGINMDVPLLVQYGDQIQKQGQ